MKQNESSVERILRVIGGVLLLVIGLLGVFQGTLGIIVIVLGAILILTGVLGWCPLYALFKFSTRKS